MAKTLTENQDILAELEKIDQLLDGPTLQTKPQKQKTKKQTKTKVTTDKKQTKTKQQAKKQTTDNTIKDTTDTRDTTQTQTQTQTQTKVDNKLIQSILAELPDKVQTKDLNAIFDFNDGGKYLRRHLRSKFAQDHEHGAPWIWTKEDKQLIAILEYFTTHLTPERKAQLTVIGEDIINNS